jgi:hypothetical protein
MLKQKVLCRAHKNARCDMCLRAKHARERFNEHATRTSALFCQSKFVLANEAAQEPLHRRSCHLLRAQQACLIRAGESAHLAEEVCGLLGCQEEGGLLRIRLTGKAVLHGWLRAVASCCERRSKELHDGHANVGAAEQSAPRRRHHACQRVSLGARIQFAHHADNESPQQGHGAESLTPSLADGVWQSCCG